jgi:hypothetical protein
MNRVQGYQKGDREVVQSVMRRASSEVDVRENRSGTNSSTSGTQRGGTQYTKRYAEAEKEVEWQRHKTWLPGYSLWKSDLKSVTAWRGKWSNNHPPTLGQVVYHILDIPESSKLSQCVSWFVLLLIVVSTLTFLMATEAVYMQTPAECFDLIRQRLPLTVKLCAPEAKPWLKLVEAVCIIIFTIEYAGRVLTVHCVDPHVAGIKITHQTSKDFISEKVERTISDATHMPGAVSLIHPCVQTVNYCLQPMNLVDLVAITPFYIDLIAGGSGGGLGVLRVLRLVRIFRILRMPKYQSGMVMFGKVLYRSAPALGVLVFLSLLCFVLFGAMLYFAEGGSQYSIDPAIVDPGGEGDHPSGAYVRMWDGLGPDGTVGELHVSPFRSIPHCFWWVATTMTTVGYGDFYPTSGTGWVIGCLAFFGGIMTLALPTTIIGAEFADLYLEWVEEQEIDKEIQRQLYEEEQSEQQHIVLERSKAILNQMKHGTAKAAQKFHEHHEHHKQHSGGVKSDPALEVASPISMGNKRAGAGAGKETEEPESSSKAGKAIFRVKGGAASQAGAVSLAGSRVGPAGSGQGAVI